MAPLFNHHGGASCFFQRNLDAVYTNVTGVVRLLSFRLMAGRDLRIHWILSWKRFCTNLIIVVPHAGCGIGSASHRRQHDLCRLDRRQTLPDHRQPFEQVRRALQQLPLLKGSLSGTTYRNDCAASCTELYAHSCGSTSMSSLYVYPERICSYLKNQASLYARTWTEAAYRSEFLTSLSHL